MGQYVQSANKKQTNKNGQLKNPISGQLSCKNEEEIKTLPDTQKLRELIITISVLQEMLKGVLHGEMKGHYTVT